MKSVFTARLIAASGLAVLLAGCSTGSRSDQYSRSRSWESSPAAPRRAEPVERVPEAPRLAPPPLSVPEVALPHSNTYAETWIPLERWSRENGYGVLRRISPGPESAFALNTTNGAFLLQPSSLLANWDGLQLHLGFEPQLIDNQPFVHRLDLQKNLEPLIRGSGPPDKTNRVVVIDPGHGGQNTGAGSIAGGAYEKEFTLDWARRLEPLLAQEGWQVFMTRSNDADISLSNRVVFAAEHRADLFISLHFNSAAPSQEQAGLETYCLTPAGMPSTLTRGYEDDLSVSFTNNAFDVENLLYAVRVHRALLPVVGNDRGVRHARFLGVLRGQNRPAVLIEGGYLSNPGEAKRIADPAYRQKLAEAIAEALAGKSEIEKTEVGKRESNVDPPTATARSLTADLRSSNSPPADRQLH